MGPSKTSGISLFSDSPMRAQYFVSNSVLLLADLSLLGAIVARFWARLPALSLFLFGGMVLALVLFWYRIFRLHSTMRELIASESFVTQEPGSLIDKALGTIGALSFQALLNSFGVVMLCLMALVEILRSR